MGPLDEAVQAHQSALVGLSTLQERYRRDIGVARKRVEQTRARLAEAIVAEALAGTRQVDIIRATGYSRERVRTILREHGVEPD